MEKIISFSDSNAGKTVWFPLSDQVRGGNSSIAMQIESDLTARFFGELRLNDQNAGFASYRIKKENSSTWNLSHYSMLSITSRGDGRAYKLLIKDQAAEGSLADYSWQAEIPTTAALQTIAIKISDLKPVYRGKEMQSIKQLDLSHVVEFGFQINDKKEGFFEFYLKSVEAL